MRDLVREQNLVKEILYYKVEALELADTREVQAKEFMNLWNETAINLEHD